MEAQPTFSKAEFDRRLKKMRREMEKKDFDACLISSPENIFYLSGLSHMGFFAFHLLIVPRDGKMALICRAMEEETVERMVVRPGHADFFGFADSDSPAHFTADVLERMGLAGVRLAMEKESLFMPPIVAESLASSLPAAEIADCSNLVDQLRQIKSDAELAYTRQAAEVSVAMIQAAKETAGLGVSEREVAGEVLRVMAQAGGTYPGFNPFVRATPTLGEEHRTWGDYQLQTGDVLFVELAGCVKRYHAPMGRLFFIGDIPPGTEEMAQVCQQALTNVTRTIVPGVRAFEVYQAWQDVVDRSGLSHYRRHHCGYMTGIGFPPSWVGGSTLFSLRHDSGMELQEGMVFHLLSWLMGAGEGNYFVSDTAVVTHDGCEVLIAASRDIQVIG